jgi:hypothetical protein
MRKINNPQYYSEKAELGAKFILCTSYAVLKKAPGIAGLYKYFSTFAA